MLQPLQWVFAVLPYLGNILTLIDSLSCDPQDKVNIMGYGTAALLGAVTSSKMAAKMVAILDFTKTSKLSGKRENCKYIPHEL